MPRNAIHEGSIRFAGNGGRLGRALKLPDFGGGRWQIKRRFSFPGMAFANDLQEQASNDNWTSLRAFVNVSLEMRAKMESTLRWPVNQL